MASVRSSAELRVAPLERADLPDVAEIHRRAFPESAITAFGNEALRRYYQWILEGPHEARLVGAWHDGRLVGFCAGGWYRGAMNGFLRANRRFLAMQVLRDPRLLTSSLVRDRMKKAIEITLRYSRWSRKRATATATAVTVEVPRFGILAIATDPIVRGAGAGRVLMEEAEQRARESGYTSMNLTVHPENHRAVRFYEQLGWQRRLGADGMWHGNMEKPLSSV